MALVTIIDMYKAFLKGINKKNSSAIWPSDFNFRINQAYKEWLKQKADQSDQVQKRMDDLQRLRYVTDGTIEVLYSTVVINEDGWYNSDTYNSVTGIRTIVTVNPSPSPDQVTFKYYQRLIPVTPVIGSGGLLFDIFPVNYPAYYRMQSVLITVTNGTYDYGNIGCIPLRDDRKIAEILDDPYSIPAIDTVDYSRSRMYYQYLQNRLHLYLPSGYSGKHITVSYIKNPAELNYNPSLSTLNVDCELDSMLQQQIVDIAVRSYLENIESPRYGSVLTEEQIKQVSN